MASRPITIAGCLALTAAGMLSCSGTDLDAFAGTWDFEVTSTVGDPIQVDDVVVGANGTFDTGDVGGVSLSGAISIGIGSSIKPGLLNGTYEVIATPDESFAFAGSCSTIRCTGNTRVGPMTFTKQ